MKCLSRVYLGLTWLNCIVWKILNQKLHQTILISGSYISRLPRHLAILGATTGKISSSNNGIQRLICWGRYWNANVWNSDRVDQLAGRLLFLRNDGYHLVRFLAVADLREATKPSNNHPSRTEVHRKVAGRLCTTCHAKDLNDTMASDVQIHARLRNHCRQLLPFVELLFTRFISKCISQACL